ncbi:MAG: 50S ribosomal protein L32 [Myxococcota bacterium]|nr:50S ribosomal protein L32 [Myxococcota bacterium]
MAVPKKRTSKRRKGMRRAHDALKITAASEFCENCGELKLLHRVCGSCGVYRGVQVIAQSAAEPAAE